MAAPLDLPPDDLVDEQGDMPVPPPRSAASKLPSKEPVRPAPLPPPRQSGGSKGAAAAAAATRAAAPTSAAATATANEEDEFADVKQFNILNTAGVDKLSRPVLVFYAYNLPEREHLDQDRLLAYMKREFDAVVESDYSIIYFHYGLNSKNKPDLSWLRRAYGNFDRKYKKNLKALYVVHATSFFRRMLKLLKFILSSKFGRKITFINTLSELEEHAHISQLHIPEPIKRHSDEIEASQKQQTSSAGSAAAHTPPPAVFGAKLSEMKAVNSATGIPTLLTSAFTYLRQNGMETEGIFRRSANALTVRDCKAAVNRGEPLDFDERGDVHLAAVLIKTFFRDMPEPIFPYVVYEDIIRISRLPDSADKAEATRNVMQQLPPQNLAILKALFTFLREVAAKADVNRMTASNLAIVLGPNLLWSRDATANIEAMGHINQFSQYLINHYETSFPE